jgi:hypothetical protein
MDMFPRTEIGGRSVSRMIIGTNWFLGYSHQTFAKDLFICTYQDAAKIADIIEVYLGAGVDTIMGLMASSVLTEAIQEAQQRTGKALTLIDTPALSLTSDGVDYDDTARILDQSRAAGAHFLLPHQSTTDALVDRTSRTIRGMDRVCAMIRDRGMIPGLSTHMPEAPVYADETGLDVETYIQIYNAFGFLMQIEVDWMHKIIHEARKPVITIKPMAAGRLSPLVGLAFVWNTIRDRDLVTVGALTPDEAREDLELSRSFLEKRVPEVALQRTRSKKSVEKSLQT